MLKRLLATYDEVALDLDEQAKKLRFLFPSGIVYAEPKCLMLVTPKNLFQYIDGAIWLIDFWQLAEHVASELAADETSEHTTLFRKFFGQSFIISAYSTKEDGTNMALPTDINWENGERMVSSKWLENSEKFLDIGSYPNKWVLNITTQKFVSGRYSLIEMANTLREEKPWPPTNAWYCEPE